MKQPVTISLEEARGNRLDLPETASSQLPEELSISKWEYERVVTGINSLDGKLRPVLILRYFNDLSYEEIAQVMNIPLGTVKSRLNAGIKTIFRSCKTSKRCS